MTPLSPKQNSYASLLTNVKQTLILGQQKIEAEKVKIYWSTGDLIHKHILQNKSRAEYGAEVVKRLARDLHLSDTVLHRCIKFVQQYPQYKKVAGRPQLSWSHYRELILLPDRKTRDLLEERAEKSAWSSDELIVKIKEIYADEETTETKNTPAANVSTKPLVPIRGQLYTYRLIKRKTVGKNEDGDQLLIDLGFGNYLDADKRTESKYTEGTIVESRPKEDAYTFFDSGRTEKDLFTYQAVVEKVIDGDTLKVRVDQGFKHSTKQILRLRDIDCPEVGTKAGDEAKTFVQSHIKESDEIILRSSRSDKYDRYLADIFIAQNDEEIFLNNVLLEQGHARRMI